RRLLSTDLVAALRPFYLAIQPNRQAQRPAEKRINEESLRLLRSHLESLTGHSGSCLPADGQLEFYMPTAGEGGPLEGPVMSRLVRVQVDRNLLDPRAVIRGILKACNLLHTDTDKESKIGTLQSPGRNVQGHPKMDPLKERSLDAWMRQALARTEADDVDTLRTNVAGLERALIETRGIRGIRYDCGYNLQRYYDCLRDLKDITDTQADNPLRDRVVVFAPYTGISLEGDVMLFSGDAADGWLDFLAEMGLHEEQLKLVPLYERALSAVLLGIQIARRQSSEPGSEARAYAESLKRVIRAVSEHLKLAESVDDLPKTLQHHQLAVVTESESPKVSHTGLFLAPSSCPGPHLVDFICRNLDVATMRVKRYRHDIQVERQLWRQCLDELELQRLSKDDSVTPDKMIFALHHLLHSGIRSCRGLSLHVTNYWSVPTDGIVCIPWDFHKSKEQ
ncbi:hypothetical protein KR074_004014, partial [Drosophila pseudoananassae]